MTVSATKQSTQIMEKWSALNRKVIDMWVLRIIWTDGTESIRAYATKKLAEAVCRDYYKDGFGGMIADYEIYKRSDVYYG